MKINKFTFEIVWFIAWLNFTIEFEQCEQFDLMHELRYPFS